MAFDIDDTFFSDQPLNGQYPVAVRVVYFDQGTGSWALRYDAVGDPQRTALTVTKTDSGHWKEVTLSLADAHLGNRGEMSSDISLHTVDDEDDIFHMLQVTRD